MEKYEISKEQILELEMKFYAKSSKELLKEWFPSAFKKELEVGKWYKMKGDKYFLSVFQGIIGNDGNSYGFDLVGNWSNEMSFQSRDTYLEATPEEWKEAMTKELIKRYGEDWENVKLKECLWFGKKHLNGNSNLINFIPTEIWNRNGMIFKDGIFAEVLDEQKELKESIEKMRAELLIMEKQLK